MSKIKYQLTELVRLLEERQYIFAADPEVVTESLRAVEGKPEAKIIRRAEMIDRNKALRSDLERVQSGILWLWIAVLCLVFTGGFSATFVLMDSQGLNFFLILASVLGMNTVMLAVWLLSVGLRFKFGKLVSNPATWFRGKDTVNQALLRLYTDEWTQPATRWRIGTASHGMWLATLFGMLVCILLLLLVRQYTFNWESTLLTNTASVKAIEWLSWLLAQFGFSVPDSQAVLNGRMNNSIADARAWSGLLVGSIVCYGLLPRFVAWLFCKIMLKLSRNRLPIEQTYYQKILQKWQTKIVDADTQAEEVVSVAPKINISDAPKWAVMLEMQWADDSWFAHTLGQDWQDKGVAESRDQISALTALLQQQPVQLLIGVRAHTVPDRGVLRQITQLAEAAQGGAVVQLLLENTVSDGIQDYLKQWQTALNERNIAWLNPPKIAQEMRLRDEHAV